MLGVSLLVFILAFQRDWLLGSVGLGLFLGLGLPLALSGGSGHIVPRMVDDDTGQEVQLAWLGV